MRIINKSFKESIETYKRISEKEETNNFISHINEGLSSIFLISHNLPIREIYDFFSGYNFSLLESYEELESSHELIRFGFYKQSMISLRVALDIGLLSIYWNLTGNDSNEFKEWIKSKKDTPYKNKKFWEMINSNEKIYLFNKEFKIIDEIKNCNLSDYVHTKGKLYSNQNKFWRLIKGNEFSEFNNWFDNFKSIVRYIEILHLLLFPTLNLRYSTDFLLKKFGTFNKIPIFGSGYGYEMDCLYSFIPEEQKNFIIKLSEDDSEVKYVKEYLSGLPDLSEEEILEFKIEEAKKNIQMCNSFSAWKNSGFYAVSELNEKSINDLERWAISKNLI